MSEDRSKAIIEQFAEKQRGGHFACPRCGRMTMNAESVTRNALSRRIDVYVCDACGMYRRHYYHREENGGLSMNKIRRKSLQDIIDQLEELKTSLEELQEEEEEYRDNMPENA